MKSFAILLSIVVAASTSVLFAQTEQSAEEVFTKFETLRGEVVDSHGNNIENFSVHASIYEPVRSIDKDQAKRKFHGDWAAKEIDGEFSFDVEQPIPINPHLFLTCTVAAEGYSAAHKILARTSAIAEFDGDFGKITLKRTVKVTGRLVMPASAEAESLLEPVITFTLATKSQAPGFQQQGAFSKDGSFEVFLPEDCEVKVIAYSQNAAAISKTVTIEKFDPDTGQQELGELRLVEGVSVSGVVLTKNGYPVENQSIHLYQHLDGHQIVSATAITDALGEFELPPRSGEVVVKLNEQLGKDGKAANSTGRKLTARDVELVLRQGEAVKPIEFREAETFLITGSVALNNGQVPNNVHVAILDNLERKYEQTAVDKDGRFAFAVPHGMETSLLIMYSGNDGESFFVSSLRTDSLNQNREAFVNYEDDEQIFYFKPIEKNIGPLDFVLLEHLPEQTTATQEVFKWILGN